jgi:chemotaxis protein methyltransferase CheR
MDAELDRIVQIMGSVHGLDVTAYSPSFLMTSIGKRRMTYPDQSLAAYGERLARDHAEAEALFASLRICYSEFFRNSLTFALLERSILPAVMSQPGPNLKKEVRVWSAACASGQEAYSIAILLDDLARMRDNGVSYRIFATDVSEERLAEGREGRYPAEAIRNVPLKYVERYFTRQGDHYQIIARLREQVDFSIFDLIAEQVACPPASIFGDFDLAVCSNLLFYYDPQIRLRIFDKMHACLVPGGYLVTGEAETGIVAQAGGFHAVAPPAPVFKKI